MTPLHQINFGLGGGSLLQLANRCHTQMMAYRIITPTGKIVMIDGGNYKNPPEGETLYRLLQEQGGHVDAWFVTHPHSDHLGAIAYVLEHYGDQIAVDQFYFNFPEPGDFWLSKANPLNEINCTNHFLKLLKEQGRPWTKVDKGFTLDLGMKFEILNEPLRDYARYEDTNDISICIKAHFPAKTVLFTGDLGEAPQNNALKDAGDKIRCDVVQMAHHGQNGVNFDFYRATGASAFLWPTPDWLWVNDAGEGPGTGPWRTLETREWMKELPEAQHFVAKDGDFLLI